MFLDKVSVEIENNSRQVLKRLNTIKKTILTLNPLKEFPIHSENGQFDNKTKISCENSTHCDPNNTFQTKST